ncbi:hypothetical protein WICPIJ_006977 [Wickerhamomyces pijperi]|uniref:Uncharacterized protein n=1 Tax=Wickerhamomyces pijperi TaxID=599730 RepID=A0A9P8Q1E4_WICPI|nr:hypothetical protein WICPIJ_006977 [Wickerhamomyces pijperi]
MAPVAFNTGGGASMAASLFLFLEAKNPPKKPPEDLSSSAIEGVGETAAATDGSSNLLICCLTKTSKACVPTNKEGEAPELLYMMVLISPSLIWSNGSKALTPFLKISWKTKEILAPPLNSAVVKSLDPSPFNIPV